MLTSTQPFVLPAGRLRCIQRTWLEIRPGPFLPRAFPDPSRCSSLGNDTLPSVFAGATSGTGTYLKDLAAALLLNTSVTELKLSGCKLGNAGMIQLAPSLPAQLEMLSLEANGIDDEGAVALGQALCDVPEVWLRVLDLTGNAIGDRGAASIAKGLTKCGGLEELSFSTNCVDDEGCKALCHGVARCRHLHAVDFSNNAIGDQGVKSLCHLLEEAFSLSNLDVNLNAITEGGIADLQADPHAPPHLDRTVRGFRPLVRCFCIWTVY